MSSRIAKNPVVLPDGVEVNIGKVSLTVTGKKGKLSQDILPRVSVSLQNQQLQVSSLKPNDKLADKFAGTMRALAANMVTGVSVGFERKLKLVGVGYRAKAQGEQLNLTVGYSHPVEMKMPTGISVQTPSQTEVVVSGADKQLVMQVAANIRSVRPPEPYKAKGIRYEGEHIERKEGKKK